VVLALVTYYLAVKGLGSVSLSLFTNTGRDEPEGLYHGIEGTLVLLGLASLVGVPMGLLTGVYLSEYQGESWLSHPVRFTCDVLAGVPSIVVGVVGYELLVVPMGRSSAWAGAAALAFIMVPIVARTTEEMLRLVPQSFREGSLALGATKAQTVLRVVLPAASGSVATGVMLALARAAGETAPLLFTAGTATMLTRNLNNPFPSLTVSVFQLAQDPSPQRQQLACRCTQRQVIC
jgi:phosphate transport system permease protein